MTINKIKIGARIYSIKKIKFDKPSDNEEIQGYIDYDQSLIAINDSLSQDAEEEALIHEILHAVIDRKNIEILTRKCDIEELVENIVTYLTPRMHSFLKDNPDFLESIKK